MYLFIYCRIVCSSPKNGRLICLITYIREALERQRKNHEHENNNKKEEKRNIFVVPFDAKPCLHWLLVTS